MPVFTCFTGMLCSWQSAVVSVKYRQATSVSVTDSSTTMGKKVCFIRTNYGATKIGTCNMADNRIYTEVEAGI